MGRYLSSLFSLSVAMTGSLPAIGSPSYDALPSLQQVAHPEYVTLSVTGAPPGVCHLPCNGLPPWCL